MRIIGLTGSIGMGKSTTAAMFAARGVPVHDADAVVHRLYAGEAVAPLEAAFPGIAVDGVIDRARLAKRVVVDPQALSVLEAIVHPLVRENEQAFLRSRKAEGYRNVLLDIPLLFETGGAERTDVVVVVTAQPKIHRARALARPGMTEEKLQVLLARQVADAEKRRRAHFLIDTSYGIDYAGRAVDAVLRALA
jgi:dephospho-CoA kinase